MQIELTQTHIALEARHAMSLMDAVGVQVECRTGQLWLTMDGDSRDIFLAPGDAHSIERKGLTLISAIEPSLVHVQEPRPRPAARKGWIARAWDWLARAGEARAQAYLRRGIYN